jgi:hypothetical protein
VNQVAPDQFCLGLNRGVKKAMKITAAQIKEHARRYMKVVEWNDEDVTFIGSALPLIGPCCHGSTKEAVSK